MEVIRLSGYTEDEKVNIASVSGAQADEEQRPEAKEELQVTEPAIRDVDALLHPRGRCPQRWSASSRRSAARWSRRW
jgi:hypothetical protein